MSLRGGAKRRRRNLVVNAICHGIATLLRWTSGSLAMTGLFMLFSAIGVTSLINILLINTGIFPDAPGDSGMHGFPAMFDGGGNRFYWISAINISIA